MRRFELFEIHDHRCCPAVLRNLFTDALQAVWMTFDTYRPIVPLLRRALEESESSQVIDLCSGAGGPWLQLAKDFEKDQTYKTSVLLTDLHPNTEGFKRASSDFESVSFYEHSVSAMRVPPHLDGFRTIFSSFHHFSPKDALSILYDAAKEKQGIAIFEGASRDIRVVLAICFLPLAALLIAPTIKPFRWSRIFWTYAVPLVPFMLWFDGLMSCLRAYSQDELLQMSQRVRTTNYQWRVGTRANGFISITYLIGYPKKTCSRESVSSLDGSEDP
jgi:hypothetical protein